MGARPRRLRGIVASLACAAAIAVAPRVHAEPEAADGGGAPTDAAAAPTAPREIDPALGPDPFTRPATSAAPSPDDAGTPVPIAAPPTPPPREPGITPQRERDEGRRHDRDDDALVFRSVHGSLRLLVLLQPQLAWDFANAAASPNAAADGSLADGVSANATTGRPDRSTTNRGTFRLRRARVGFLVTRGIANAAVEVDPNLADRENPASGSVVRRLEVLLADPARKPRWEIGAGVFDVPFSRDLAEPHGKRIFVDRAYGTRAMFPDDADMGVRVRRAYPVLGFDVQLALLNGVTLGEPTFGRAPDLNKTKDGSFRMALARPRFEVGLGGYVGQGQAVDPVGLRVQQRPRAALAIDALFRIPFFRARGSETRLSGEVVVGRNMDRGVASPFVNALAPVAGTSLPNFDPRSAWIRLEQDFRGGTVGVRYDVYTPESGAEDDSRHTIAAAVARAVTKNVRVMLEYDHVIDRVHAPDTPAPVKLVDRLSAMVQLAY